MSSTILVFSICVILARPKTILPIVSAIAIFLPRVYFQINRAKWSLRLVLAALSFVLYRITISVVGFLLQWVYSTLDLSNEYISAERILLTLLLAGILMIPSIPLWDTLLVCCVKGCNH